MARPKKASKKTKNTERNSVGQYLTAFRIKNFRGLQTLQINDLKQVNIFAGINGSGKTTLLEALFLFVDRRNPIAIMRPHFWRNLQPNLMVAVPHIFSRGKLSKSIELDGETRNGHEVLRCVYEKQSRPSVQQLTPEQQVLAAGISSVPQPLGVSLIAEVNGEIEDEIHLLDLPKGGVADVKKVGTTPLPKVVILNRLTIGNPSEIGDRLSQAIQSRKKAELIRTVKLLRPEIRDLELLKMGDLSIIYGNIGYGVRVPLPFLGDGMQTLLSICLAIMDAKNGMVFLDEFEAAIHYSKLSKVWRIIFDLSVRYNCQIFAATHSKECIEAAIDGITPSNSACVRYFRLQPGKSGIKAISYSGSELVTAIEQEWEVR